jgi:hypothetical protein
MQTINMQFRTRMSQLKAKCLRQPEKRSKQSLDCKSVGGKLGRSKVLFTNRKISRDLSS